MEEEEQTVIVTNEDEGRDMLSSKHSREFPTWIGVFVIVGAVLICAVGIFLFYSKGGYVPADPINNADRVSNVSGQEIVEEEKWTVYEYSDWGIKFEHPADWEVTVFTHNAGDEGPVLIAFDNIPLLDVPGESAGKLSIGWYDASKGPALWENNDEYYETFSQWGIKISDNVDAVKTMVKIVENTELNAGMTLSQVVVENGDRIYSILYKGGDNNEFDRILATFEFIK